MEPERIALPPSRYHYIVTPGVCVGLPGLYEWHIDGVGSYIGQYGRIRQPTRSYGRNVTRLLNNQHYRLGNEHGFRSIHHAPAIAHRAGLAITLTILENVVDKAARNRRERELILKRGKLNGKHDDPG